MAGTQGTSARSQRLITAVATCLLGATTAFALGRVFLGGAPTLRLLFAAVASGLLACACERRNLAIAAALSAVGLLVVVGILIFPGAGWHGVPTAGTVRAIVDASRLVGQQARLQVSPTPPLQPLMLAALTATWAAVFSAHALAFRAGSPLLALLPPVALLAFADTVLDDFIKPIYGVEFLAAALVVIFADGVRRVQAWGPVWASSGPSSRLSRTAGRGARRVAFAAVSVALVSPLLVPGFGSKALLDLSGHAHPGITVDVLVSVANQLKRDDTEEVFTVQTPRPTYYRLLALPEFDGVTWRPDPNPQTQVVTSGSLLGPIEGLSPDIGATAPSLTQQFRTSTRIDLPLVPTSYPPVSIQMGVSLHWDEASGSASLDGAIDAGTDYTVTSLALQPTPTQLRGLDTSAGPGDPSAVGLPSNTPPEIASIAQQWTVGASTMYDKVMAIQDHLLDAKQFTYDATVPALEGSNAMLTFLTRTKRGFCQQFSSAMAVLLRSIGIPARIAVGFTAGTQDAKAQNTWHVTTENAHAWVEVLFPQYGWLPFEPTPGRSNPVASAYTDPAACHNANGTCASGNPHGGHGGIHQPKTQTGKQASFNDRPTVETPPSAEAIAPVLLTRRVGARKILAAGLLIALVGFLLFPFVRATRRRLRLRRAAASPRTLILATYDVFTERAGELGYGRPPGETLDEYRARVAASGLLRNGDLERLTRITSSAAYAQASPGDEQARAATSAAATALKDIRRGTPLTQRMRGRYLRDP
jgi:transglutaminase-like putative cysteine protease